MPLPTQHTTNARDQHSCSQRDSNPRFQQTSGCRPTPQTARPPGSAHVGMTDDKLKGGMTSSALMLYKL